MITVYYLPLAASSQMVLRVPFEQAQAIATVARDTFYFLCQNGGGVASFHSGKDWINSFQAKVSCQKQNVDDQDITDYVSSTVSTRLAQSFADHPTLSPCRSASCCSGRLLLSPRPRPSRRSPWACQVSLRHLQRGTIVIDCDTLYHSLLQVSSVQEETHG